MAYEVDGDIPTLLAYQSLEVGMTFLLSGMLAEEEDKHSTASQTPGRIPSVLGMLKKPHPAVVLDIDRERQRIIVGFLRSFNKMSSLGFMAEGKRIRWAPVYPALWEDGVDPMFFSPLPLEPVANESNVTHRATWVYLGRSFRFSADTPLLGATARGPLQQRFSRESVDRIIGGLARHQVREENVTETVASFRSTC